MTLLSERWLDEVLVTGTILNTMGADFAELFTLPAGIGDMAIMEIEGSVTALATPHATPQSLGVLAHVLSPDEASVVDIVGVSEVRMIAVGNMGLYWSPDPLVLWRQGERLTFRGPELDINVSPTGDLGIRVKCVRVRPVESTGAPIRLVR